MDVPQDFDGFDRVHPSGADYVIMPALINDADPAGRMRRAHRRCVQRHLGGRQRHPGSTHVPHRRYLVDRDVATTTGITASIPVALALVEAMGGRLVA